jgi:hypothetical protein
MPYRKKLTIDHTCVLNEDQTDFPLLISLTDPDLKSAANGGRVAHDDGGDIHFSAADGTPLAHERTTYDPHTGALKAWVRIPQLSCSQDTSFYLCYGGDSAAPDKPWDENYRLVLHLDDAVDPELTHAHTTDLNFGDALTVEAWVYSDTHGAEAMQPLVSKWEPLTTFNTFSAYDAGHTDDLETRGYFGAVFDGQYVYFCPIRDHNERTSVHGRVLRFNTHKDFGAAAGWEAFDASYTDGLHTAGFYGGAFDGRYVYFNPRDDGTTHHSRVLRYDTQRNFKDSASWQAHDAEFPHSGQGIAFDGRYLYCCPGYTKAAEEAFNDGTESGQILRIDTHSKFKDATSYKVFDATTVSPRASCFDGGLFDGRYIYFVPLGSGEVLRYDSQGDYSDAANWQTYDARPLGMQSNVGAIFDGRYVYFCSYSNSNMVRFDIEGDFDDDARWQVYNAANTNGLDTGGFDGGFFDGRYIYYMPFTRQVPAGQDGSVFHTNYLRYDTAGAFDDPAHWTAYDASVTDGLQTSAYNAGAFDGRYFYAAPWRGDMDGDQSHGRVLRCDTLGTNGSFSLRYSDFGHNGGLNAAVPGPNFLVNTTAGVVSASPYRALIPGWHHLVGIYNGDSVKLFIDGVLAAERGTGGAPIQSNKTAVSIGRIDQGAAHFPGRIDEVRLSSVARSDDWIKTTYRNLANPAAFIRVGTEETMGT